MVGHRRPEPEEVQTQTDNAVRKSAFVRSLPAVTPRPAASLAFGGILPRSQGALTVVAVSSH
jgi:hypothetical protein